MTVAELTPHTLTHDEADAARTAFNWALRTRFLDMWAALRSLPLPALEEVELAMGVFCPTLRLEIAERRSGSCSSRGVDGNDRVDAEDEVE